MVSFGRLSPSPFKSSIDLSNLYQVGEDGNIPSGEPVPRSSVQTLASNQWQRHPVRWQELFRARQRVQQVRLRELGQGRPADSPYHLLKAFQTPIADGEDIYPHPKLTQTVDYEGELGVIVGKKGFRIGQEEAMDYVWGHTIVNNMTARERQRDHKQFYSDKSPDTFCPMARRSRLVGSPAERPPTDTMAFSARSPSPPTNSTNTLRV